MKNREMIKRDKICAFRIADVLVYSAVALLVFLLFLCFVILPNESSYDGFKITLNGEEIFLLKYKDGSYKQRDFDGEIDISESENEELTITVFCDAEKTEYNVLLVSLKDKTVKVTESNCSIKKDCVHSPSVNGTNTVIACMPHGLKIVALGGDYIPITTGSAEYE